MGPEINVNEILQGFKAKFTDPESYVQNPIAADAEVEALGAKLNGIEDDALNVDKVVFETTPAEEPEVPEKDYATQSKELKAKLQIVAKELNEYITTSNNIDIDEVNSLISKYTGENLKNFVLEGITDEGLRKEAEKFIKELEKANPKKLDSVLYHNGTWDYELQNIYKNVRDLHLIQITKFLENNPTNNVTSALEALQQGFYYGNRIEKDSNEGKEIAAKIESGELTGRDVVRTEDGAFHRIIKIGHQYASDNKFEKYALETYKNDVLQGEMGFRMLLALQELEKSGELANYKSDDELVAAIKEKAGVKNGSDREFEKFIKKNSNISEIFARKQQVMARREELKHVSWEYICDNLSTEARSALSDYITEHEIKEGEHKGEYDLSGLSEIIEERSARDFFVNTHEDVELNELESIRKGLVGPKDAPVKDPAKFDPYDKTNPKFKLTREIVDFCGYKVQKRNHMPTVLEAALGLFNGGASSAVGFMTAVPKTREVIYHHILDVNNNVIINTPEGQITIQQLYNDVIHKVVTIDEWKNLCCAVRNGSLTGLALAIITDAIIGRPVNEKSCIGVELDFNSADETFSDPANYKAYLERTGRLDKTEEARIDAAVAAAEKPGETKPWHEIYRNGNVSDSGHGLLNCEERIMSSIPEEREPEKVEPEKPRIITAKETIPEEKETITYDYCERQIVQGSSWQKLAEEAYNCGDRTLKDVFPDVWDRVKVLKLALCITDGDYSEKRMRKLLGIWKKIGNHGTALRKAFESETGFDLDAFFGHGNVKGFYNAPCFPTEMVNENGREIRREVLYLPRNLAGIDKCKDLTREQLRETRQMTQAGGHYNVVSGSNRSGEIEVVTQQAGTRYHAAFNGQRVSYDNDSTKIATQIEDWRNGDETIPVEDKGTDMDAFNSDPAANPIKLEEK